MNTIIISYYSYKIITILCKASHKAAGCRHTAVAGENGLQLIEIQLGDEIDSADKQKYEL